MKIKDGFILKDVGGKTFVVAVGEASKNFNGMISLNETGKIIWQSLIDGKEEDEIVDIILPQYDAPRDVVEKDVKTFIERLKADNIVEKSKETLPMKEILEVIEDVVSSDGEFRFYPKGNSMYPLIKEGEDSVVLVAPKNLKNFDIILYVREDGQAVLHRIVGYNKDGYVTCGDNQVIYEHGVRSDRIKAKVAYLYNGETKFTFDSKEYARYVKSLPNRRRKIKIRNAFSKLKRKFSNKKETQ